MVIRTTSNYIGSNFAIRPVVALPKTTTATNEGGVWKIPTTPPPSPTLAQVTNDNIGDYVDIGNNIVGTESTSDDWRVLYVDDSTGTVYAILADYLPNSTGYAEAAGLDTKDDEGIEYTYSVYSKTTRAKLLSGLSNETAWNGLANGITGAKVTGSPTQALLSKSYNTKNGFDINNTVEGFITPTGYNDLYLQHTSGINGCYGYWLNSPSEEFENGVKSIRCSEEVVDRTCRSRYFGIRPVISLPKSTTSTNEGGVWTID